MANFIRIFVCIANLLVLMGALFVMGYSFYIASFGMALVALAFILMCGFFAYNDFKRFVMQKEEKAPEQDSINSEDSL